MAKSRCGRRRVQVGFTLLEMIVALSIAAASTAGVAFLIHSRMQDTEASVAARYVSTVAHAAEAYIQANYTAVAAHASATSPALIRVADLEAGGYLKAGFPSVDAYGQSACVIALQPQPGTLAALVVTEGGRQVDDLSLGQIAAELGAQGGGIYAAAPGAIRGAAGGWFMAPASFANANDLGQNCAGAAGSVQFSPGHPVVALWSLGAQETSPALYRNSVPNVPSVNTMNTPILMAGGTVVLEGSACTTTGAIARDANGLVMSCAGGVWHSGSAGLNWKGTLPSVANLPAAGNAPGDTWRIAGFDGHAFTWDAAHALWQGITLAADGSFHLPGVIYADASSSSYSALSIYGSKNGYGGVNFKDAAGNNLGTLMMNSNYSGFFNSADNGWRFLVDNAGNATVFGSLGVGGNTWVNGSASVNGNASVANNTSTNSLTVGGGGAVMYSNDSASTNDWAITAYGGGWWNNAQPESGVGSIYANDVYLRSNGRWMSQRRRLDCYAVYLGWYAQWLESDLSYASAAWCAPGYSAMGFNSAGADGTSVWGGWTGDRWPWTFCCGVV